MPRAKNLRRQDIIKAAAVAPAIAPLLSSAHAVAAPTAVNPLPPSAPLARPADLVLKSGKIITVDRAFTVAEAVAVAGERILAVGPDEQIAAHIAPWTRVIDLNGRSVIPGLVDGHAHLDREGLKSVFPALGRVRSIRDI